MNPYVASSALQGGLGILGGMFGARSARKAQKQGMIASNLHKLVDRSWFVADRADERHFAGAWRDEARAYERGSLDRMREDAIRAGFNPLTVLGLGGGGTTAGGPTMAAPMSSGMGSSSISLPAPPLSSSSYVVDALGDVMSTWFNREQLARDDEMDALRLATMQAELQAIQEERDAPLGRNFGFDIPSYVAHADGSAVRVTAPALSPIPRHFSDRGQQIADEENLPSFKTVTFPDGISVTGLNDEAFGDEISEIGSSFGMAAQYLKQKWDRDVLRPFYGRVADWWNGR